ncbi:phage capsid protein [Litorimonas cladophorae]|uniref:Phage capsid protein n=1 Tax=Litorimonas cladophorae TaxID=1220491 RepID=A0A918K9T8_9PROT|nr:phage major capsid protein [Litorimonas cladophorae]GGX56085.1 phage capsid protein [Litorimonas cladophorae]
MTAKLETKTTGPSLNQAQVDFASTFAAFRDANDMRLAEIEAKSSVDPLLSEKVERLNTALDAQTRRIENLTLAGATSAFGAGQTLEGKSANQTAWDNFIRTGDASALTTGVEGKSIASVNGDGSLIAPVETETRIDAVLAETSPMRRLATVRTIGASAFRKPVSTSGAQSGWAGETDARLETEAPTLELIDFPTGELYAMPAATQALLDDSVADVDAWLAEEVRDVFAAQETAAFISGDGVNKPRGFINSPDLGVLEPEDFDTDALIDLIYAPQSRYRANASFVMNRRTINTVRKFKDADGNYIWQPSLSAGAPSTLLGYPLVEMEDMPDIGSGVASVAFGDFRRGYLIADRQGVRVLRDPYSAKPYVLFYTTKRVGGGVQDSEAIKLLKIA